MDWVTAIWSVMAGACLMLALMHLVIWCFDRNSWANLWFFIAVISLIAVMTAWSIPVGPAGGRRWGSGAPKSDDSIVGVFPVRAWGTGDW